jgi:hypothetical protein
LLVDVVAVFVAVVTWAASSANGAGTVQPR